MSIKNKNTVWNKAHDDSRDADKYIQLPKIASASLPTVVAIDSSGENEGGIAYDTTNNVVKYCDGTSWTELSSTASATAYDDIGNPDANGSITMAGYTGTYTSATANWGGLILANTHANPTAGATLLSLDYTANGDAHAQFLSCADNSAGDEVFTIKADGATTIAGNAAGTDALTITAGDATLTSGHLVLASGNATLTSGNLTLTSGNLTVDAGDIKVSADSQKVTWGASDATDSYIEFSGTDLTFYDSTVGTTKTLTQLAAGISNSPTVNGDLTISDGKFDWTDSANEVAATWSFAATTNNDIDWGSSVTTGACLAMTADDLASGGDMVLLDSDGLGSGAYYLRCNDGSDDDFSIGQYGGVTIAGNAATDVLTITAGDIQITAGDIDLDAGKIEVDTTTDETTYVKRNQAATTGPVVEIEETHANADNPALLVDHNPTGDVNAIEVAHDGTGYALSATGGAAGGEGFEFISAASATGCGLFLDGTTGSWVGAAGVGFLQMSSDGTLADADAHLVQIDKTGETAASATGSSLHITDASTGGSTSGYAVYFNASGALEALHVDAGTVQFDEALTIGASGGSAGADLQCYGTTNGKYMIWDESANQLQLTDSTEIVLGGTPGTEDGLSMSFDGTSTIAFDAITANDALVIGANTNTDVSFQGATAGADADWDASGDSLTFAAGAKLVVAGATAGDGTTGLEIPYHATATPSGTPGTGSIMFEVDANKLWVFNGTTWVGTVLS